MKKFAKASKKIWKSIEKIYFDPLTTLSNENSKNGKDYISVMKDNIELLKRELYEE